MENTNKEKDYGHMENTEDGMVRIPAVALRGMTVLPGLVIHFDLNRGKSILAVEKAMMSGQRLFLVTQRDVEDEEPDFEGVYHMGCDRQLICYNPSKSSYSSPTSRCVSRNSLCPLIITCYPASRACPLIT